MSFWHFNIWNLELFKSMINENIKHIIYLFLPCCKKNAFSSLFSSTYSKIKYFSHRFYSHLFFHLFLKFNCISIKSNVTSIEKYFCWFIFFYFIHKKIMASNSMADRNKLFQITYTYIRHTIHIKTTKGFLYFMPWIYLHIRY